MVYVFTSAAGPRVTYTGAVGDELLRQAGKTPAARGVISVAEIDEVIARLRQAVAREAAEQGGASHDSDEPDSDDAPGPPPVPLARRVLPFFELLERSRSAGKDVTWGI